PAISGTTFERSRMPPLESMIPGFSRPRGPKRTSFMDSPRAEGGSWHQGDGIMRRVPAPGKEVRAVVGRMGSGQSAVRKGVSAKGFVRCISVAHRQQTPRYWSNEPFTRRFHLQSEPSADRITAWT